MTVSDQQTTALLTNRGPANGLAESVSVSSDRTEQVQAWIVSYLADLLEISADELETDVPFDTYGLDSSAAIGLTGDLEDWLGQSVDPTLLYDYPTVDALVAYLCED
ncbi:MAG: acyl carrier protein [Cyanobacteria bacterium J06607_13]